MIAVSWFCHIRQTLRLSFQHGMHEWVPTGQSQMEGFTDLDSPRHQPRTITHFCFIAKCCRHLPRDHTKGLRLRQEDQLRWLQWLLQAGDLLHLLICSLERPFKLIKS